MSGRSNYYNPESDSGAAIFVVVGLVITLIIVGIILALYFTCTAPFNTDSCICSKSSGTWDDTKTPKCTCKTTDDLFDKKCVIKCKTGETRDDKGVCVGIPLNNPPNTPNNPTCPNNQILLNGKCTCPTSLKLIGGQCVEPLSQFTKLPNQAISGYNKENYQATTPEACALLCLDRSWCNSIDYNHDDKSCFLQDNPPATATYSTTIWDNYKRK